MLVRFLGALLLLILGPSRQPASIAYIPQPLTLDRIFSPDHSWTATLSGQPVVTLVNTGDILTARTINADAVRTGNYDFPFSRVGNILSDPDITFINLENPLLSDCPVITSGFTFCGRADWASALSAAGIDVVNIANNHIGNFGTRGISETVSLLQARNLQISGTPDPASIDAKGLKFAFLGFNDIGVSPAGINSAQPSLLTSSIAAVRDSADVVVVQFHWGSEYTTTVSARQRELARLAIDSGADVVVGNHPHWVQPLEIYGGKLILYSHGNFIFDQYWSLPTRQGILSRLTFFGPDLVDAELVPVEINLSGQPQLAEPYFLSEITDLSYSLARP